MDQNKIQKLEEFSGEHPNVDVNLLLQTNLSAGPNPWKVYLVSVFAPPFGLYYTVKYLLIDNDSDEKRRVGWLSLILTIVSIVVSTLILSVTLKAFVSSQPALQQNPQEILHEYRDLIQ